jgi:hypothetical protein
MLPFTLLGPLLRFSDYERQLPWKTTKRNRSLLWH